MALFGMKKRGRPLEDSWIHAVKEDIQVFVAEEDAWGSVRGRQMIHC